MDTWQRTPPPNERLVEVECNSEIITVMAFYGRDGESPHWTTEKKDKAWPVTEFTRWREIAE